MGNAICHIKRYLVLLLMMIYFIISLTYILFLPAHNLGAIIKNPTNNISLTLNTSGSANSMGAANSSLRLHCLYKSIPEKKIKIAAALFQISPILTIPVFIWFGLLSFLKKQNHYSQIFIAPYFCYYLRFRTLRI